MRLQQKKMLTSVNSLITQKARHRWTASYTPDIHFTSERKEACCVSNAINIIHRHQTLGANLTTEKKEYTCWCVLDFTSVKTSIYSSIYLVICFYYYSDLNIKLVYSTQIRHTRWRVKTTLCIIVFYFGTDHTNPSLCARDFFIYIFLNTFFPSCFCPACL